MEHFKVTRSSPRNHNQMWGEKGVIRMFYLDKISEAVNIQPEEWCLHTRSQLTDNPTRGSPALSWQFGSGQDNFSPSGQFVWQWENFSSNEKSVVVCCWGYDELILIATSYTGSRHPSQSPVTDLSVSDLTLVSLPAPRSPDSPPVECRMSELLLLSLPLSQDSHTQSIERVDRVCGYRWLFTSHNCH